MYPPNLHTWYFKLSNTLTNFGEGLYNIILQRLKCTIPHIDDTPPLSPVEEKHCLLGIGSEFHQVHIDYLLNKGYVLHVWGFGNGKSDLPPVDMRIPRYRNNIHIYAVRGPITKQSLQMEEDIHTCDPGFTLPLLIGNEILTSVFFHRKVVYAPHHLMVNKVSYKDIRSLQQVEMYISTECSYDNLFTTMKKLRTAKFVLTSAMHVMIFCLAFRVPCALCLLPDEPLNMPTKWRDMFGSLNYYPKTLPIVRNFKQGKRWWDEEGRFLPLPDAQKMLDLFPFKNYDYYTSACK